MVAVVGQAGRLSLSATVRCRRSLLQNNVFGLDGVGRLFACGAGHHGRLVRVGVEQMIAFTNVCMENSGEMTQ